MSARLATEPPAQRSGAPFQRGRRPPGSLEFGHYARSTRRKIE